LAPEISFQKFEKIFFSVGCSVAHSGRTWSLWSNVSSFEERKSETWNWKHLGNIFFEKARRTLCFFFLILKLLKNSIIIIT
jgi:hypothetical protein